MLVLMTAIEPDFFKYQSFDACVTVSIDESLNHAIYGKEIVDQERG